MYYITHIVSKCLSQPVPFLKIHRSVHRLLLDVPFTAEAHQMLSPPSLNVFEYYQNSLSVFLISVLSIYSFSKYFKMSSLCACLQES